jgi:hypothetical protein
MAKISGELIVRPGRRAQLMFSLTADKGSPEEQADLEEMARLVERLTTLRIPCETFERNTPDGDKVDQVRFMV